MWRNGSPEDFVNPFMGHPVCYLLEFAKGERFVAVRYDPNALGPRHSGLVNLQSGAVVTDRPIKFHEISDPGGHEIIPEPVVQERDSNKSQRMAHVRELEKAMQCNCDLDNWTPEETTGHSWVCRIHQAAMRRFP